MSDPRYNTRRWRRIRARQLAAEPYCRACRDGACAHSGAGHQCVRVATVADHIKPHRGNADLFWYGELQSLCAECHSSTKQAEENAGGVGIDGWPCNP